MEGTIDRKTIRDLCAAIIMQAVRDAVLTNHTTPSRREPNRAVDGRQALAWFASEDNRPFSFRFCLEQIGKGGEVEIVRAKIRRYLAGEVPPGMLTLDELHARYQIKAHKVLRGMPDSFVLQGFPTPAGTVIQGKGVESSTLIYYCKKEVEKWEKRTDMYIPALHREGWLNLREVAAKTGVSRHKLACHAATPYPNIPTLPKPRFTGRIHRYEPEEIEQWAKTPNLKELFTRGVRYDLRLKKTDRDKVRPERVKKNGGNDATKGD